MEIVISRIVQKMLWHKPECRFSGSLLKGFESGKVAKFPGRNISAFSSEKSWIYPQLMFFRSFISACGKFISAFLPDLNNQVLYNISYHVCPFWSDCKVLLGRPLLHKKKKQWSQSFWQEPVLLIYLGIINGLLLKYWRNKFSEVEVWARE